MIHHLASQHQGIQPSIRARSALISENLNQSTQMSVLSSNLKSNQIDLHKTRNFSSTFFKSKIHYEEIYSKNNI